MTLEECKVVLAEYIRSEMAKGTRKANVEIDLIHFIKRELYGEGNT